MSATTGARLVAQRRPFANDTAATWPAVASIPLTFFGVLAVLLAEAYRERREARRTGSVAAPET